MRTQSRNWSLLAVCFVGCLVVGAIGVGAVAADESYDLTVSDAVDVPPQTVDDPNSNTEFEIDAFAVRDPGESLEVDVTIPRDTPFTLDVVNSSEGPRYWVTGEGPESVIFGSEVTRELSPGTYSLALYDQSQRRYQAVHPVVISGYDISAEPPAEVEQNSTLELDIDISPTELEGDPAEVEIVLWNENEDNKTKTATGSDGAYSSSIDLEGLDTGTYNLHIAALGDEEFQGKSEILGLSKQYTVNITEADSGDETNGGDEPANGDPVDSGGDGPANGDPVNESDGDNGNETVADPDDPTETVEVVDTDPDTPGVYLSFENTTVRALTLTNESATGNVTVTDRSALPTDVTAPEGTPIATIEIEVPDAVRNEPAMLEFVVDADAVNDTDALGVERYDSTDETWTKLEHNVSETTASTVTVIAETPGFSMFAVTETADESESISDEHNGSESDTDPEPESESDSDPITPNETEPPSTPEDQVGFGVVPAVAALIFLGSGFVLRRSFKGR